ncbi:MAG: hypothetical protein EXR97_01010 [Nitrospiraceae bacterium]|nr:hypothetical protein [Nitrospiraceae bacterium]MSR23739.1 hypothetical protein [Nitrospiraceae bacterium]
MEVLIEVILQILGEIILQLGSEVAIEGIWHKVRGLFRRIHPFHAVFAGFGYACLGAFVGGVSLWLFPAHFVKDQWLRVLNLIAAPVIAGLVMAKIGAWRRQREQEPIRLDTFAYGFLFAFAMALVRFVWAK